MIDYIIFFNLPIHPSIKEAAEPTQVTFHPGGSYILVGTKQQTSKLWMLLRDVSQTAYLEVKLTMFQIFGGPFGII